MNGEQMQLEMDQQPAVIARIAERVGEIHRAVRGVRPHPFHGTVFVGRGSSDNAAVLGRYVAELNSGRPAGLAAPSLHTRYAARVDYRGYLVVGLSQSGATPEVIATCQKLRHDGARLISITNDNESALAGIADLALSTDAGVERAVPATKTVTAQMMLMLVVAGALAEIPKSEEGFDGLSPAIEVVLADRRPARDLAAAWSSYDRMLVTARGLCYAAALEGALKIKETSRVLAEGISAADLLHGPIAAVDTGLPVLCIDGGDPTADDARALVERLNAIDAPVATCSPSEQSTLPLPPAMPEALYPILATVRGQQFAYELSLARGLDPDEPIGLTKVTPTR
jgi:glucosamine--fructose-6-phosphate aminotransferase (isomerizing)